MQVDLREGDGDLVLNELLVDDLSDIRFHVLDAEHVVAEEEQFKVERGASKINETGNHGRLVRNVLVVQCALPEYFDYKVNVTAIGYPHLDAKPCFTVLVAPVDHLVGGDDGVGNDDRDIVTVDRFRCPQTDLLDLHHVIIYLQHIPYMDRSLKKEDDARDKIVEGVLQTESDTHQQCCRSGQECV